jgi:hypothetical protein
MFNFKIIRHDDYHGDPICFSITHTLDSSPSAGASFFDQRL